MRRRWSTTSFGFGPNQPCSGISTGHPRLMSDGWFNTGDSVEVDGEWLRILGRKSEIINVGGEKVYPAEVENVLHEVENIRDAAVIGRANPISGQVVLARVRAPRTGTDRPGAQTHPSPLPGSVGTVQGPGHRRNSGRAFSRRQVQKNEEPDMKSGCKPQSCGHQRRESRPRKGYRCPLSGRGLHCGDFQPRCLPVRPETTGARSGSPKFFLVGGQCR